MSETRAATTPELLDPTRRADVLRMLRAEGGVVPVPGVDGVMAAVRFEAVASGLSSVYDFEPAVPHEDGADEDATIAAIDEPRHSKVRRIINSAVDFHKSQRIEAVLEGFTFALLDRMLDEARDAGPNGVDLVARFASPLAAAGVARLIGFPQQDAFLFVDWLEAGVDQLPGVFASGAAQTVADREHQMRDYVDARIEERLAIPEDVWPPDALTRFLVTDADGERLTPRAIRAQVVFMLCAGVETTRNAIGNLFYRLAGDPAAYDALRIDPLLLGAAVEETLRLDSPTQLVVRTCVEATQIGGVPIDAGQRMVICIGSGNRDEGVFPDAESFRLDRAKVDHLAFGAGPHACPGSVLARIELHTALRCFASRVEAFGLAYGYQFEPVAVGMSHGPRRLPIVIEAETPWVG